MPNKVTELYRQYLAQTGQTDNRSDYEITAELGQWASQNNPNLFNEHPDFGEEYGSIREANAPSLVGEGVRALKSGAQGLASTALGGLSLLTDSDYLREKAESFEQDAAANAPTVGTLEDITPGRSGIGSLFSKDAARYAVAKAGQVAPSIGEALVTGAAGALAGSAVAPGPGTVAGAAEGVLAKGLIKSAIKSLLRKRSAEALVERGIIGEATEEALEAAVRQNIGTVTDLVGREAMAIGARRGMAATNLANSYLLNAGDVYSEGGDRSTAAALGLVSAIPDSILPTYVVGRLFPGVAANKARDLAKTYVSDRAMKALKAAGVTSTEAATEYFQEAVNVVARNLKEGKDALAFTPEDYRRFREAGIAGAFGGAIAAPGILIEPKVTSAAGESTPADELGAQARARQLAEQERIAAEQAEQQRLAQEAEAARNAEAAQLMREQQAATMEASLKKDLDQLAEANRQQQEEARIQRTALGMVGETPERAAERAGMAMAGATLDMTDPNQAARRVGEQMMGNVPVEPNVPTNIPSAQAVPPVIAQVAAMDAPTFMAWAQQQESGITPVAYNTGISAIKSPPAIEAMRQAYAAAEQEYNAVREQARTGDPAAIDSASSLAAKVQFFSEAIGAAERSGSAALAPEVIAAHEKAASPVPDAKVIPAFRTSQTSTPEFKAWFGESKVVDRSGAPTVMYHGTSAPEDFSVFMPDKMDPKALFGPGIYTTANPDIAGGTEGKTGYSNKGSGTAPRVIPVFVKLENPFNADAIPESWSDTANEMDAAASRLFGDDYNGIDFDRLDRIDTTSNIDNGTLFSVLSRSFTSGGRAKAQAVLRDLGFDGVIHTGGSSAKWNPDVKTPHLVAIAFSPEQVKSSIGNRGTFDPTNPDITYRQAPVSATVNDAAKTLQFNAAVANLKNIGANIQAFSREMLAQNTADVINQRIASLQQEQQAAQDPVVKQELGRRIAVLQERLAQAPSAEGVTYSPWQIALAVDDIGNANAGNLVTLLHEAGESLTMRLTPEIQGAVSNAINAALPAMRARAQQASQQTGVPLSRESGVEDLLAETLAQEMTARGVPDASSLAQAIIRWVKDVYYRTALALQASFGGQPDPDTALSWFENQLRREALGDYNYTFANLLDRYMPTPMQERIRRFKDPQGTPGGIADFVDPVTGKGTQPNVETLDRASLNWNLEFRSGPNPGEELEIPDPEARARIKGAMLNGLAEFYERLRGEVAPTTSPEQFFQQIKRVGEESPQSLLADLEQRFPGSGTAKIGGERMTEAMNRQAQVELWGRLRKFGLAARRRIAQAQKTVADGTSKLSAATSTVNKLESDIRNAAMHEDLLKLSAKDMVATLAKSIARGYTTAHLEGSLAEAIRQEENLLSSDPIPEQYQNVLQTLYAGGLPVFDYVKAIAEMDLPLEDMSVRDIIKEIRTNPTASPDLSRLKQNKPLLVALASLAKRNADQVDQIQLGWERDLPRYKQIHEQLEEIRNANAATLRELNRKFNERGKAAGLVGRLKASYLAKRNRQQSLSNQLKRAEEQAAILEKALPAIDSRTETAAQEAGGAQYEWYPEENAVWTAMRRDENGDWQRVRRVLRFNPDNTVVDGDQMRTDIASNMAWLTENAELEGTPRYNQVKQQTYALRLLSARGHQRRMWSSSVLTWLPRFVDRFVRTPTAFARTVGGPAFGRIIQMLNRYQGILRRYVDSLENPSMRWQKDFIDARDAAGLKDNAEFKRQAYFPALYFISTNPGLDESAAFRQATTLAKRSLPSPKEDFADKFMALLRRTRQIEPELLRIAEESGVFVSDKALGSELRRAVPRGAITGMKSLNGGIVDVVTKDMQNAGWKLAYDEETKDGKLVKTDIRPATFEALDPANAPDMEARAAIFATLANDQAMRPLLQRLFTSDIINQWLEPFIYKTGQEPFVYQGKPVPQILVQEAWQEANGDVLTWIDRLGLKMGVKPDKEGTSPTALFRLSMLRNLDSLFGHEAKLAYDAMQAPNVLDRHGPKPHTLMDARVSDLLPAEHIDFATYEPESVHRMIAQIAYHGAFGRDAKNIKGAFGEISRFLEGKMAQWRTLTSNFSTKQAQMAEAKRRDWDYEELREVSRRYQEAKDFKSQLEALLGVSADSGPLGDYRKGMAMMNFITGQIVDTPKTAAYDLLSVAMRPLSQGGLTVSTASNSAKAAANVLQTGLGSLFQSFGLHLFNAGRYADTIGQAEGRAFGNLPWGVVMSDIGQSGQNQQGVDKWLVKPTRLVRQLQRKGAQVGAGETQQFPRLAVVPGLGVMNSISQIAAQGSASSLAQEFEQVIRDGMTYMADHPEAANNPAFIFRNDQLAKKRANDPRIEWWREKAVEYNLGNIEDIVRDASKRASDNPQARLLTDEQARVVAMIHTNELSGNSSINTTPAWLMSNRWAQMAMPLLRWPLWMMSKVHEQAKPREGENAVLPMLRVLGTMALWNLPLGIAFTILMDEYDEKVLGKKSNLPNVDKTAAIPVIGLPLSLLRSDKPLDQLESLLVRSARAGNIYGLGQDFFAQTIAGLDPSTGQRSFSLDQRVMAFSQIANIGQAIRNWIHQDGMATWGSVGRPVLMAVGGNGALHSVDVLNNLLDLDNAQARLSLRASAANWIRSAAQELDIEIKRGAFGGTPTPLSANTREMYLAALANDRADFLESYRRALDAARVRVTQDPDVPASQREQEAANRVLSSWRSRNPMAVLAQQPTGSEIARMLQIMDPQGQEAVREAMSRYDSFTSLIEPTQFERYMRRQISTQRRTLDPQAMRRQMTGGLMFSTR